MEGNMSDNYVLNWQILGNLKHIFFKCSLSKNMLSVSLDLDITAIQTFYSKFLRSSNIQSVCS